MRKRKNKGNNKGLSLIELLVALAVGVIVMSALTILMTQGINQYNKMTVMTQLQEDANIALNNISNSIMEANFVTISNSKTNATFQTGSATMGGKNVIYEHKNGMLYVGENVADSDTMGLLCKNVKEFKIDVVSTSFKTVAVDNAGVTEHKVAGINNPVQIKVTLKLEFNGVTREVSRVAAIRNRLSADNMTLQGFKFADGPSIDQFAEYIAYD